jgi:BirA family transcriptional regulator, biotin operon repressor / biotin---[acetyl-CoA-carboxylase] ligase
LATLQRLAPAGRHECLTLKPIQLQGVTRCVALKILRYKQLQSTNTTAYTLGEKGSPEWTVVVADIQTKGKGRSGKRWESPKGGLWFSILLKPDISSARVPMLQFLAANATRQALEDETDVHVQLKWPNDLVVETGKLGGILIESKTLRERVSFAVVGIGLNVNQRKTQLPMGATSLLLSTGIRFNQRRLLRRIVDQIISSYDDIDEPSSIIEEWWHNCIHRPPKVQITVQDSTLTGITRGIDETGALTLETDDRRIRKVSEGTLRVLDDFAT